MAKVSDAKLLEAIQLAAGNFTFAAKSVGISRRAIYLRISTNPKFAEDVQDIKEGLCDVAESTIYTALVKGDKTAAFFWLNNSKEAKARGWGPRNEVTGVDGGAISIRVVYGDGADG